MNLNPNSKKILFSTKKELFSKEKEIGKKFFDTLTSPHSNFSFVVPELAKWAPQTKTIKEFIANATSTIYEKLYHSIPDPALRSKLSDNLTKTIHSFFTSKPLLLKSITKLEATFSVSLTASYSYSIALLETVLEMVGHVCSVISTCPNLQNLSQSVSESIASYTLKIYHEYCSFVQKEPLADPCFDQVFSALLENHTHYLTNGYEDPKHSATPQKKPKMTPTLKKEADAKIIDTILSVRTSIAVAETRCHSTYNSTQPKTETENTKPEQEHKELSLHDFESSSSEDEEKVESDFEKQAKFDLLENAKPTKFETFYLNKKRYSETEWENLLVREARLSDATKEQLVEEAFYNFMIKNTVDPSKFDTMVEVLWRKYAKKKLSLPEDLYDMTAEQEDLYQRFIAGQIEEKVTYAHYFKFFENKINALFPVEKQDYFNYMKPEIQKLMPDWLILLGKKEKQSMTASQHYEYISRIMSEELEMISQSCVLPPDHMIKNCSKCGKQQTGKSLPKWGKQRRFDHIKFKYYDIPAWLPCSDCIQGGPLDLPVIDPKSPPHCNSCGRYYIPAKCEWCEHKPCKDFCICPYCNTLYAKSYFNKHLKKCWSRKYQWFKSFPIKNETAYKYLIATGKLCIACGKTPQNLSRHQKTCRFYKNALELKYPLKQCGSCKKDYFECNFFKHTCSGFRDEFTCLKCNTACPSLADWVYHRDKNNKVCTNDFNSIVKDEAVRCKHCDKAFPTKSEYADHIKKAKKGKQCMYSKSTYTTSGHSKKLVDDYTIYTSTGEIRDKRKKCEICKKIMWERNYYRYHIRETPEIPPSCKALKKIWEDKYKVTKKSKRVSISLNHGVLKVNYTDNSKYFIDPKKAMSAFEKKLCWENVLQFQQFFLNARYVNFFKQLAELPSDFSTSINGFRSTSKLFRLVDTKHRSMLTYSIGKILERTAPQFEIARYYITKYNKFMFSRKDDGKEGAVNDYHRFRSLPETKFINDMKVLNYTRKKYFMLRELPYKEQSRFSNLLCHQLYAFRAVYYLYQLINEVPLHARFEEDVDADGSIYLKLQRVRQWASGRGETFIPQLDSDWGEFLAWQEKANEKSLEQARLEKCRKEKEEFYRKRGFVINLKKKLRMDENEEFDFEALRLMYNNAVHHGVLLPDGSVSDLSDSEQEPEHPDLATQLKGMIFDN